MGQMSVLAKNKGYIVSMAPSESYLDYYTNEFSLSLKFNYPEWETIDPKFSYHGKNCYAYLLKKYEFSANNVKTFDFISLQLYETKAHALYKYRYEKRSPGKIFQDTIENYKAGWLVKFSSVPETELEDSIISVEPQRLVIGLANTLKVKVIFLVTKDEFYSAYNHLRNNNLDLRGFMFWNIADETPEYCLAHMINNIFNY